MFIGIYAFLFAFQTEAQPVENGVRLNYVRGDSLINSYWEKGDFISVIYYLDYFIKFDTTQTYLYHNRSIAKWITNDYSGSCRDFKRTIDLNYSRLTASDKKSYKYTCDTSAIIKYFQKHYYPGMDLSRENGYRPVYTLKDTLRGMLIPSRSCYDVTYYELSVKIIPNKKFIEGNTRVLFNVLNDTRQIQLDLFDNYQIDSIIRNREKLNYTRKDNAIFIDFNNVLKAGFHESVTVFYQGKPPIAKNPPWFGGFVWKSKGLTGVACEYLGASSWWPVKDHLSDKPDSMIINLDIPKKYKGIANGNLVNEYDLDKDYRRYTWKVNYPIPNYDVTFYYGDYITVEDSLDYNGEKLLLDYYVLPKDKSQAMALFDQSKEVLKVYTDLFGPYPFPKDGFALVESPYEGMENQGAIAFGNKFKHRDKRYINNEYDYIIVHEIAHEWWGNAISFSDMADAWLSEGFATYSEMLFMEHEYGYLQYEKEISHISDFILNIWPVIGNADVNENTFASGDIYNKGAILLHNLRCIINNDEVFMKLLKDYFQKYKYQSINTDAFIEMAGSYSGMNLDPFFHKFLHDTDPPVLSYNIFYEKDSDIILAYKWDNVEPGFTMPFPVADNKNKAYALSGTSSKSFTRFENVEFIKFITYLSDDNYSIVPVKNSFTYYRTKLDTNLKL